VKRGKTKSRHAVKRDGLIAETLRPRLYGLLNLDTAPREKLLNEIRASEDIHSAQVIQL
jgi:hypothetical protein